MTHCPTCTHPLHLCECDRCVRCATPTSDHCDQCGAPLCSHHLTLLYDDTLGVCPECYTTERNQAERIFYS